MSDFLSDLGKGIASSAASGVINTGLGLLGQGIVNKQARDNYQWQYDNFLSPKAQVKALTAAGLNPAAAFGNNAPVLNSGGLSIPANPLGGIGTSSLSDISNYIMAKSQAKKNGAEVKNLDIDAEAKQFELDLNKLFSSPERVANLTAAWKNVRLQDDEHNIKQWTAAKEKALSELSGVQRDTAQKVLDNMDIQIQQENKQRAEDIRLTQERQKTERTSQSANVASANASNAAASVSRENRRLQAALADIEEAGKTEKINSLIAEYKKNGSLSEADAKEAALRLSRLESVEDKRSTTFFKEVDNYLIKNLF